MIEITVRFRERVITCRIPIDPGASIGETRPVMGDLAERLTSGRGDDDRDAETAPSGLAPLLAGWEAELSLHGIRDRRRMVSDVAKILGELGWRSAADWSYPAWVAWLAGFEERTSRNTARYMLSKMCSFERYCQRCGMEARAATLLPSPPAEEKGSGSDPFLWPEAMAVIEAARLEEECGDRRFRPIRSELYAALVFTSLRPAELKRLTPSAFALDGATPHIRLTADQSRKKKPQTVPLLDAGAAFFGPVIAGRPGDEPLFPSIPKPGTVRRDIYERAPRVYPEIRQGPRFTLSSFRKVIPHAARIAGVDKKIVTAYMGHSGVQLTERYMMPTKGLELAEREADMAAIKAEMEQVAKFLEKNSWRVGAGTVYSGMATQEPTTMKPITHDQKNPSPELLSRCQTAGGRQGRDFSGRKWGRGDSNSEPASGRGNAGRDAEQGSDDLADVLESIARLVRRRGR